MLNRDFTKSNKDYFNKNKIFLIVFSAFLLIGIVILAVFGMKGNFEFTGYNEFSVRIGAEQNKSECANEISTIVMNNGIAVDTLSVLDQGDNTRILVRYITSASAETQDKINADIIEKLEITIKDVSEHTHIAPVVKSTDYIYTATAILVMLMIATIFAYFRYNGASAICVLLSCLLGTLMFLSIGAILRLTVGLSYFALMVILNVLIVYVNCAIFEEIRGTSWLQNNNHDEAIKSGMKASRFKLSVISIALMLIGVLLVILAPTAIKYVSLNILFMAVVVLAVALYIVPFVWSVFITYTRKKMNVKVENKD